MNEDIAENVRPAVSMETLASNLDLGKAPKLRFPEFQDAWPGSKLGNFVTQMQSGLSRKLSSIDIGLPVIRSNNIQNDSIDVADIAYWYATDPQGANTSNYFLNADDLLINFINSPAQIGKFALYNDQLGRDAIFTTNIMRLKFRKEVASRFVFYSFSTKRFNDFIQSITKPAVNQASFTTVDLKSFELFVPQKEEQQRIVGLFAAVDDKIDFLTTRIQLLQKYKNGAIRAIFLRSIRFKSPLEVAESDWHYKTLGDIGNIVTGKTPATSDTALWNGEVLFVTPTDIETGSKYQATARRTVRATSNMKILPIGTIYYTCIASIGKMSISTMPSITNQQINSVIPSEEYVNEYIYYALLWLSPKIKSTQANTTLPIINKTEFSKFEIPIPKRDEQQKIADFLGSVDTKIRLVESELKQATTFKKALLQRMFI